MFGLSPVVVLMLGVGFAFTGVTSLKSSVDTSVATSQATTLLPPTFTAHSGMAISMSTSGSPKPLPTTSSLHGALQLPVEGGFSAGIRKVSTNESNVATTESQLYRRDNFGSDIRNSWLVVLSVGTPAQTLDLSLDIGSDGFVVFSTLEPEAVEVTNYPIYNPDNSTTAVDYEGYTWSTTYGGFSLVGDIYTDVVTIGDTVFQNITMEVTTDEPTGSTITTASGILGLADHMSTGASPAYVTSFLGSIKAQLPEGLFSIWFNSSATDAVDGTIDFGYIDSTKYTGEIAYTDVYNVNGETFWAVNISGIGAADPKTGELLYSNMTEFQTILDTGSEQSSIPLAATWGWYGAIDGVIYDDGGYCYDYPCSVNTSLPDIVLFIGDQTVVVPRNTFAYWETMHPSSSETPGYDPSVAYCTMHVANEAVFGGPIIGQDILEGLFMVYDFDNQRVGFANSTANNDASFYIPGSAV